MATLTQIYDVAPIAQSKDMSCWAAAAAMLLTWRAGIPVSEISSAQQAGGTCEHVFNADRVAAIAHFARAGPGGGGRRRTVLASRSARIVANDEARSSRGSCGYTEEKCTIKAKCHCQTIVANWIT
jgi:hypothetical protein